MGWIHVNKELPETFEIYNHPDGRLSVRTSDPVLVFGNDGAYNYLGNYGCYRLEQQFVKATGELEYQQWVPEGASGRDLDSTISVSYWLHVLKPPKAVNGKARLVAPTDVEWI